MARNTGNLHRAKSVRKPLPDFAVKAALRATLEALEQRQAPVTDIPDEDPDAPVKPDRKPQREIPDEEFGKLAQRLENREAHRQSDARSRVEVAALNARWSYKQGTPETLERIESVPSRHRHSPLSRMYQAGTITIDDLAAASEIEMVWEELTRQSSYRVQLLQDRINCSGSANNPHTEGLNRIRCHVTYTIWRDRLPTPKQMILDMILTNTPYVALAKQHNLNWRTARKRLITAIRLWQQIKTETNKRIDRDEIEKVFAHMGMR